jgi:hypothetical protein
MRALLGRVKKLEVALAAEIRAHNQSSVAEALRRLSDEQLDWLKSAAEADGARQRFTDEERIAMRAYDAMLLTVRT